MIKTTNSEVKSLREIFIELKYLDEDFDLIPLSKRLELALKIQSHQMQSKMIDVIGEKFNNDNLGIPNLIPLGDLSVNNEEE